MRREACDASGGLYKPKTPATVETAGPVKNCPEASEVGVKGVQGRVGRGGRPVLRLAL